jgi:nucleoside-diphosphate-sugar epimerase
MNLVTIKKIAIFGANGHIAKNIIYYFLQQENVELYLFTTNKSKCQNFINSLKQNNYNYKIKVYEQFNLYKYDCIINCIGLGTFRKDFNFTNYFKVIEYYDNLIISYLQKHSTCNYINMSSGAVHKEIHINDFKVEDIYTITKLNSEYKHRTYGNLKIIDLRIYSFFSRFADIENDNYFINEIINCILKNKEFNTTTDNIIRDFIHPVDFMNIIKECIQMQNNCFFEIGTKDNISKNEILNYFQQNYNLKINYTNEINYNTLSGSKLQYYPEIISNKFNIQYSSLDTIKSESDYLLNSKIGE